MFEIILPDHTKRQISTEKFPAMDGWDIQQQFIEFAASRDKDFRRAYTLEVLKYASVMIGSTGESVALTTDAIIDNHLQSWENVKHVFETILRENGIDPATHANVTAFWVESGAQMAIGFTAEMSKLLGPAMEQFMNIKKDTQ